MNINIYNPYVRDELMHHGILGQKWGKRNGPPYPLFAGAHSASEKKAGWRKSPNGDGASAKKSSRSSNKIDVNSLDDIEIVDIMLGDPDYKSQRKELKKRFDYLNKREQAGRLTSTGHPLAKEKLEDELRELSKIADKSNDKITSDDIERRVAFQGFINDLSIDVYSPIPRSERAKKWKQDYEKAMRDISDTIGSKASDIDHEQWVKAEQIRTKYRQNHKDGRDDPTEWKKVLDKIDKLYNDPKLIKAWKDWDDAYDAVHSKYTDKLTEVVLEDLNLPVTDDNKLFIRNSMVINWLDDMD